MNHSDFKRLALLVEDSPIVSVSDRKDKIKRNPMLWKDLTPDSGLLAGHFLNGQPSHQKSSIEDIVEKINAETCAREHVNYKSPDDLVLLISRSYSTVRSNETIDSIERYRSVNPEIILAIDILINSFENSSIKDYAINLRDAKSLLRLKLIDSIYSDIADDVSSKPFVKFLSNPPQDIISKGSHAVQTYISEELRVLKSDYASMKRVLSSCKSAKYDKQVDNYTNMQIFESAILDLEGVARLAISYEDKIIEQDAHKISSGLRLKIDVYIKNREVLRAKIKEDITKYDNLINSVSQLFNPEDDEDIFLDALSFISSGLHEEFISSTYNFHHFDPAISYEMGILSEKKANYDTVCKDKKKLGKKLLHNSLDSLIMATDSNEGLTFSEYSTLKQIKEILNRDIEILNMMFGNTPPKYIDTVNKIQAKCDLYDNWIEEKNTISEHIEQLVDEVTSFVYGLNSIDDFNEAARIHKSLSLNLSSLRNMANEYLIDPYLSRDVENMMSSADNARTLLDEGCITLTNRSLKEFESITKAVQKPIRTIQDYNEITSRVQILNDTVSSFEYLGISAEQQLRDISSSLSKSSAAYFKRRIAIETEINESITIGDALIYTAKRVLLEKTDEESIKQLYESLTAYDNVVCKISQYRIDQALRKISDTANITHANVKKTIESLTIDLSKEIMQKKTQEITALHTIAENTSQSLEAYQKAKDKLLQIHEHSKSLSQYGFIKSDISDDIERCEMDVADKLARINIVVQSNRKNLENTLNEVVAATQCLTNSIMDITQYDHTRHWDEEDCTSLKNSIYRDLSSYSISISSRKSKLKVHRIDKVLIKHKYYTAEDTLSNLLVLELNRRCDDYGYELSQISKMFESHLDVTTSQGIAEVERVRHYVDAVHDGISRLKNLKIDNIKCCDEINDGSSLLSDLDSIIEHYQSTRKDRARKIVDISKRLQSIQVDRYQINVSQISSAYSLFTAVKKDYTTAKSWSEDESLKEDVESLSYLVKEKEKELGACKTSAKQSIQQNLNSLSRYRDQIRAKTHWYSFSKKKEYQSFSVNIDKLRMELIYLDGLKI